MSNDTIGNVKNLYQYLHGRKFYLVNETHFCAKQYNIVHRSRYNFLPFHEIIIHHCLHVVFFSSLFKCCVISLPKKVMCKQFRRIYFTYVTFCYKEKIKVLQVSQQNTFCSNKIARKSSCVTARGVLPAA